MVSESDNVCDSKMCTKFLSASVSFIHFVLSYLFDIRCFSIKRLRDREFHSLGLLPRAKIENLNLEDDFSTKLFFFSCEFPKTCRRSSQQKIPQ